MGRGGSTTIQNAERFVRIPVDTLYFSAHFDFDLYLCGGNIDSKTVFLRQNNACHTSDLDALRERGLKSLYVRKPFYETYLDYLRNNILARRAASPATLLSAFKEVNRAPFADGLQSIKVDKLIEAATRFGQDLIDIDLSVSQDLFDVLDHDDSLFTHATNVSVCTILLAKKLSIHESDCLASIAIGALLHDLGKRKIAQSILTKPGRLTGSEIQLVKDHPRSGFEELSGRLDFNWSQSMMVYQHHERIDGSGYPVGIPGDQIEAWARICAVANAFDALTSHRAYRRAISVPEALQVLIEETDTAFDGEITSCWTQLLKTIR